MTASQRKSAQTNAQTNRWILSTLEGVTSVSTSCTDVYADAKLPCPQPPLSRRLDK